MRHTQDVKVSPYQLAVLPYADLTIGTISYFNKYLMECYGYSQVDEISKAFKPATPLKQGVTIQMLTYKSV